MVMAERTERPHRARHSVAANVTVVRVERIIGVLNEGKKTKKRLRTS